MVPLRSVGKKCSFVMSVCQVCPQGCDTLDKSPNGTCPKYWQRPDGSPLCSQAWACLDLAMVHSRIIGGLFLLIVLIYVRIMYYNYKRDESSAAAVARNQTCESITSCESEWAADRFAVPAGCFNQFLFKIKLSPRTLARCLAPLHVSQATYLTPLCLPLLDSL